MRFILLFLVVLASTTFAIEPFYQNKTAGWFWYKETKSIEKKETQNVEVPNDLADMVDFEKEELDRILKIAIKKPTEENLINFIKLRNKMIDQSYNFGIRLQQINLMHPELDTLKTYPINQTAKAIYKEEKKANIEKKIATLTKTHGLFYVFASYCPYCHKFAPTVKNFANKYGWSVLPITLDGRAIADFPNARQDNGTSQKLNITAIPALIMVEPKTGKVMPISTGLVSEEDIIERIDLLTRDVAI